MYAQRDPFFDGLWADVQDGIDAADAGDLFELEDVARELRIDTTQAATD